MCAYERSPEYNSILSAILELLPEALSLIGLSPVDILMTDPLGRRVGVGENGFRITEFPAIYSEGTEEHKNFFLPYVPGLPYTVSLTGTGAGNYTLQANRVVDDAIVTKEMVGETTPGESDVFSLTLTDDGIDLAKQGVILSVPTILSGTAVELEWTMYNEPDFNHYEIYVSESIDDIGTRLDVELDDPEVTSFVIGGLMPETTYFFTVRVNTTSDYYAESNRVGAVLPPDITQLLLIAAGVAGGVVFISIIVILRRRTKS
jgi:hypothetical protein